MPRPEIFKKFKEGKLRSGSGHKVTSQKQAVAIAMQYHASTPFIQQEVCHGYKVIG